MTSHPSEAAATATRAHPSLDHGGSSSFGSRSPTVIGWVALLALLAVGLPSRAQEQSVSPHINRPYEEPEFARWVGVFERPGREVFDRRHAIVEATGVKSGMVVADIGAGTGLFTRLFAPRVGPSGRVYAVDISEEFVEAVVGLTRRQGLTNVAGIVNEPRDTLLPEDSIDLAFICDTYHHFEFPYDTMRSIHRALRPEGTVVVVDFRKVPGYSSPWVMGHVRADKPTVVAEIESVGFRLLEDRPFMRTNYFLRFAKVGEGAAAHD
jgi:ubiquinone/menaquinone biosynthesis C-methylase UbiE